MSGRCGQISKRWLVLGAMASALPLAAHAQSSVTLYGVADAGVLYTSHSAGNAGKQFSFADGGWLPDEFGLRGVEDLGGGLKTTFVLESGYSLASGAFKFSNGNFFGRQAWISIGGTDYGVLKVGMQYSPFFLAIAETDPREFAQVASGLIVYVDNFAITGMFSNNTVSYTSPTFYGLQASASLAMGNVAGDFADGRQYSARVQYSGAGLLAVASILKSNPGTSSSLPPGSNFGVWGRMAGVAYTYGTLTAKASFTSYKEDGAAELGNVNVYAGGLSWQATYTLTVDGGVWVSSDRDDTTNHSILVGLGTQYALSKQTSLYTQLGWVHNHGAMDTGDAISGTGNIAGLPPGSTVAVDIGMRHSF
jgi:predicted porin